MILYREDFPMRLRIKEAKPREEMVGEMYADIRRGTPWTKLDESRADYAVLTIWDDYGHRYIYKVTDYDALRDVYQMEWPD